MKEKGIFLVATLALLDRVVNTPGVPEYARQKAEPMFERHLESFKLAVEMGVKIGSGSDAFSDPVTPFGRYNSHEIELQQQAGPSSTEALRAATSSTAELLGLGRMLGSLEIGRAPCREGGGR